MWVKCLNGDLLEVSSVEEAREVVQQHFHVFLLEQVEVVEKDGELFAVVNDFSPEETLSIIKRKRNCGELLSAYLQQLADEGRLAVSKGSLPNYRMYHDVYIDHKCISQVWETFSEFHHPYTEKKPGGTEYWFRLGGCLYAVSTVLPCISS